MGTRITILDIETNKPEEYSILGAWDTDVANNIISYLSVTAAAVLNKNIGEEVDLPTEESSVTRRVRLTGIELAKLP